MSDQRVCATCSPRGVLMQAMTGRGLLSDGKEEGASLGSPAPSHRHKRPQLYLPYRGSCLSTLAPGPEGPPSPTPRTSPLVPNDDAHSSLPWATLPYLSQLFDPVRHDATQSCRCFSVISS